MDHLPKLEAGDLVRMSTNELRDLDINEVRALMHRLGLDPEGVTEVSEGLTRLFENAHGIEDLE